MTAGCVPLSIPGYGTALTSVSEWLPIRASGGRDDDRGASSDRGLLGGTDRTSQPLRDLVSEILAHADKATTPEDVQVILEPSTVEYAVRFALHLPAAATRPDILVDDEGEYRFEWDFGPRRAFTVAVGRDGTLNIAGLFGYESSHGEYTLGEELPSEIVSALNRVGALDDSRA